MPCAPDDIVLETLLRDASIALLSLQYANVPAIERERAQTVRLSIETFLRQRAMRRLESVRLPDSDNTETGYLACSP